MTSLPTLRRKILRSFSIIVLLYGGLGIFLVSSVFLATRTTPKMLHVNYDSIAASDQMQKAWAALDSPDRFPEHSILDWKTAFEKALTFAASNITEPGEKEIVQSIGLEWEKYKTSPKPTIALEAFGRMRRLLTQLVEVNEKGMFTLAGENASLSHNVLIWALIYFFITLLLAAVLADGLAVRISKPLKKIAEAIQRRPESGKKLKLAQPDTLELFVLSNELEHMWDKVLATQRINVSEIVQQKQKLETVLESVEDALLVLSSDGRVAHCNTCLLSIVALPAEEVSNQAWNDLPTMNENYLKLRSILKEDMAEAKEIDLIQGSLTRQFAARSRKIVGITKAPIATLFLLHDITEKKRRDRFRSEFIDLLSHEIKTPLQSLGTASEFLLTHQNELPEHLAPFAETISEDVERIRAVANEFVQVTQSHSKIMKLNLELVAANQLIPEWIKSFKIVAKDRDVNLIFKHEGSAVIWANMDKVKFPWVVSNLLANAIRFSPPGGEVEVLLTDRNGGVELKVRDEGPGISEEDQKRIYEPFYQGQNTNVQGWRGLLGVGLTITKEVVEAHDGRIEYHTRQPHGSEFRILLPFPERNYS